MIKEVKTVVICLEGWSNDWKEHYRSLAGAGYVVYLCPFLCLLFVHFYTSIFF